MGFVKPLNIKFSACNIMAKNIKAKENLSEELIQIIFIPTQEICYLVLVSRQIL